MSNADQLAGSPKNVLTYVGRLVKKQLDVLLSTIALQQVAACSANVHSQCQNLRGLFLDTRGSLPNQVK